MHFTAKNDFIVKHRSADFFDKDQRLFIEHCPNARLHAELMRANPFTRSLLDGKILLALLEKVSPEEILNNRNKEENSSKKIEDNELESKIAELESKIAELENREEELENPEEKLENPAEELKNLPEAVQTCSQAEKKKQI
jgi:predicted RNase H-like nuclease (RuvC/YqgF family)